MQIDSVCKEGGCVCLQLLDDKGEYHYIYLATWEADELIMDLRGVLDE